MGVDALLRGHPELRDGALTETYSTWAAFGWLGCQTCDCRGMRRGSSDVCVDPNGVFSSHKGTLKSFNIDLL